ncbi:MAG: choice-of-anchor D domain-containing protein, partial [Anaerolineae bacterium]|nr:choice-of-anchor D domain-containing protein [Anaerolineae bacterium]
MKRRFLHLMLLVVMLTGLSVFIAPVQAAAGDFTQITWSNVAAQPFSNSEAQSVVVKGKLYSFGGFDSTKACCTPTRRVYVYDPVANTWTNLLNMPKGLTHAGLTTDGTNIYYAGGYIENADQTGQAFGTNQVWRYNVGNNTYTALPNLPKSTSAGQLVYLNGKLHLIGGTSTDRLTDFPDHFTLDLNAYANNANTPWVDITVTAPLPNVRQHAAAVVLNNKIYYIGGQKGHDGSLVPQDDVHAYDPTTNSWTQVADLPAPRNHMGFSTFVLGGRIFVLGGQQNHGDAKAEVFAFDPTEGATGAWTTLNALPAARHSAAGGIINNAFYLSTGNGASTIKGMPIAPYIVNTTPVDNATNVNRDTSISTSAIVTTGSGNGIDAVSVFGNVSLVKVSNNSPIPANLVVSGGNDALTLQPTVLLEANTAYRFEVTSGVTDEFGNRFLPYVITFTTGTQPVGPTGTVDFTRSTLSVPSLPYSTVLINQADNQLYANTGTGDIYRWNIQPDGTVSNQFVITLFPDRFVVGLEFDPASTPGNPILWVTHNRSFLLGSGRHFTGALSKLTVQNFGLANESWTRTDYIVGLPRSFKDHLTNSIDFGPDGALYFMQGSISAMGSRDPSWDNQPEVLLSAAVLRVDPAFLNAPRAIPLDVKTGEVVPAGGNPANTGSVEYLADNKNYGLGSSMLGYDSVTGTVPAGKFYNPQAPGAPLTIYASGIRNAYDLVWHSNGNLYVATNGSAGGGRVPVSPTYNSTVACQNRLDKAFFGNYVGPTLNNPGVPITQFDFLYNIKPGKFYGHPNPMRCEIVMNGGNPTSGQDAGESVINGQLNTHYPVGTLPDRNYGGYAFDFQNNKSPNGSLEYKSDVFGPALQNKLIVARYTTGDLTVLTLGTSGIVINENSNVDDSFEGLSKPLDITEHIGTGNLYVAEYHEGNFVDPGSIYLLRPQGVQTNPNIVVSPSRLIYSDYSNNGATTSTAQTVTIQNTGNAPLVITNPLTLGGTNANQYKFGSQPSTFTVQPGGSVVTTITFDPTTAGIKTAALQIASNDPDTATSTVNLRGLGFASGGGSNEPSLQRVLDTYELLIDVGDDDDNTNTIHSNANTATGTSLGADELPIKSFKKAGAGNVTLELLSVFGPTTSNPVVEVGWYPVGTPGSTQALFNVSNNPTINGQMLKPPLSGSTSFDPGTTEIGFYSKWPAFSNRLVYSEDALNTWEGTSTRRHKVRVYPLKDSSGIVPNAYILATEETNTGFDYQDVVYIVRNVKPAEGGEIYVENRDWAPLAGVTTLPRQHVDNWFAFSRIQNTTNGNGTIASVHDQAVLRINNQAVTGDLTVTGINIGTPAAGCATTGFTCQPSHFTFTMPLGVAVPSPTAPLRIPAGGFVDITVNYVGGSLSGNNESTRIAALTIVSSDENETSTTLTLGGFWQSQPEGGQEPDVAQIARTYGFKTTIVGPGQQINN